MTMKKMKKNRKKRKTHKARGERYHDAQGSAKKDEECGS